MENIKLGFFDVFGHIVPGTILFLSIFLPLNDSVVDFRSIQVFINQLNVTIIFFFLFVAYLLSNVFHQIGYLWFRNIGKRIWISHSKCSGQKLLKGKDYSILNTLIRHNSPNNATRIAEWVAKRAMSFNLSFSFFLLSIASLLKIILCDKCYDKDWIILLVGSIISSFLILHNATAFNDWYHDDVYTTIKTIELDKKIDLSSYYKSEIKKEPTAIK